MKRNLTTLLFTCPLFIAAQNQYQSLDSYWTSPTQNQFTEIAGLAEKVVRPNDLDFNPSETNGPNELWVINEGTESSGGTTLTILNPGETNQQNIYKKDGNSWHFMALPTGMAFGDDGNWGSSPGIYDANRSGGQPFTGPSLWSGDLGIYAITPPGGNGSHLDMLHQSPYSMGIAHDKNNVYWVFDGLNSTLVRYDFVMDHGPGNSWHDDGKVHFYKDVVLKRDPDGVPGHMILDKESGLMYICDTGNDRIVRVDITTGTKKNDMPFNLEPLAERWEMQNVTWEPIITTGLSRPCGIDLYGDRLVVTDNETNEIIFYDVAQDPVVELGRIPVTHANANIRGIKVGPYGKVWFVDYNTHQLIRIDHPSVFPLAVKEQTKVNLEVWPNPVDQVLRIRGLEREDYVSVKIYDNSGRQIMTTRPQEFSAGTAGLDVSSLPTGLYLLSVQTRDGQFVQSRFVRN